MRFSFKHAPAIIQLNVNPGKMLHPKWAAQISGNAPREAVSFDGEEWAEDTDYDPGEAADGEKYFDDKWGEDLNEESDFAGDSYLIVEKRSERIGTDGEIGKDWKILERWF